MLPFYLKMKNYNKNFSNQVYILKLPYNYTVITHRFKYKLKLIAKYCSLPHINQLLVEVSLFLLLCWDAGICGYVVYVIALKR